MCAGELEGLYLQISLTMLIEFMFTYLNCIRLSNGLWQLADGTLHTHYQHDEATDGGEDKFGVSRRMSRSMEF